jgi:hypothetical protein
LVEEIIKVLLGGGGVGARVGRDERGGGGEALLVEQGGNEADIVETENR